jgi:predicted DNA-binding protein with PD1-like motif
VGILRAGKEATLPMHCRRVGDRELLVVLEKDEKVVANLLRVAADEGIEGGWCWGLGSLKDIELGYYELPKRTYLRRHFAEDMELTGFTGNFAMAGPERVLHAHATVSGPELISFTGHLFEARVAVIGEFLLRGFGLRLERAEVASVGLKLLQPEGGRKAAAGKKKEPE